LKTNFKNFTGGTEYCHCEADSEETVENQTRHLPNTYRVTG